MGRKGYCSARLRLSSAAAPAHERAPSGPSCPALRAVSLLHASLRGDTPCSAAHWLECESEDRGGIGRSGGCALRRCCPLCCRCSRPLWDPLAWLDHVSAIHLLKSLAMKLFPKKRPCEAALPDPGRPAAQPSLQVSLISAATQQEARNAVNSGPAQHKK